MFQRVRTHWKIVIGLLFIVGILAVVTYSFVSPRGYFSGLKNDLKVIDPGKDAPYTDLEGNVINLEKFKGKPLIVNSWATWMPFSATELPLLASVTNEHKDAVTVLAINRMEQVPVIRSFMSVYAIPDSIRFVVDTTDHFYKAVGGYAMPETVFYDKDGVIVMHKRGVLTKDELEQMIQTLLTK